MTNNDRFTISVVETSGLRLVLSKRYSIGDTICNI